MNTYQRFSNFILYSYWRSSCSWRVRIVLNILKISYEIKPIHLVKGGGEQYSEIFKTLNPAQKVPVLEFFDNSNNKKLHISESNAIIEFLIENFPDNDTTLLPKDTIQRARVRILYNHIACNIQPIQNLPVLNKVNEYNVNKAEWAKYWITKGLDSFEELVKETKGTYCVGDNVTLADIYLVPQLYNARRFNVELDKFPNLLEVEANVKNLESFIQASPDNQPDAEK